MRKLFLITILLIVSLPLMACSGETPTEEPLVELPTETSPPENTDEHTEEDDHTYQIGTPVTSLDQIVGTWIASADLGNFVTTINPDGRLSVATSLVDLEAGSTDSWDLSFEGEQIIATGFALCLGDSGIYLAYINEDGTLKFTSVLDPCDARLRKMDRSLPGRLNPYNLVYFRVE
jgi:hypothetical protein